MQTFLTVYLLASALTTCLVMLAGWQTKRVRARETAYVVSSVAASAPMPVNTSMTQTPAEVRAAVFTAVKRVMPALDSQGIRVDVAVRHGLQVRMTGEALADLVEEMLQATLRQARAKHLLLTAMAQGTQIAIKVTDDAGTAEASEVAGSVSALAERAALRGGALDIDTGSREGTTLTLRLAMATAQPQAAVQPVPESPAPAASKTPAGASPVPATPATVMASF